MSKIKDYISKVMDILRSMERDLLNEEIRLHSEVSKTISQPKKCLNRSSELDKSEYFNAHEELSKGCAACVAQCWLSGEPVAYFSRDIPGLTTKDIDITARDKDPSRLPDSITQTNIHGTFNPSNLVLHLNPKRWIFITTQKEGIHCYPAAGTDPKLKTGDDMDVSFLAMSHRHIIHFNVKIEVFHDDRDLEFIQVKRQIDKWLSNEIDLNSKSCEMMAELLFTQISIKWPNRDVTIEVSEDGENGAIVEFKPFGIQSR